jgi:hypothetical protein
MLHHAGDVLVEQQRELPAREVTLCKPVRVVAAPHQAVAADLHMMGLREANHLVALAKVVGSRIGTQRTPLHRIFRFNHAEFAS